MSTDFFSLLRCPQSYQTLIWVSSQELAELNMLIREKKLRTVDGKLVTELLESALIREDRQVVYPVRSSIPVLLPEAGICIKTENHRCQ